MKAKATLAFVLTVGLAASMAHAQGTLTGSNNQTEAGARYRAGGPYVENVGLTPDHFPGTDYVGIEDRFMSNDGFAGKGYAYLGATYLPSSPGLGGPFGGAILDACTSAEVFASDIGSPPGQHDFEVAWGRANGVIEFSLTTSMNWTWIGGWQGNTYNTGSVHEVSAVHELIYLGGGGGGPFHIVNETRVSNNGIGDWVEFFSRGGTLGPGNYRLTWSHESYAAGGNTFWGYYPTALGGAPLVSCINSTFRLVPAPGSLALLGVGGLMAARRRR